MSTHDILKPYVDSNAIRRDKEVLNLSQVKPMDQFSLNKGRVEESAYSNLVFNSEVSTKPRSSGISKRQRTFELTNSTANDRTNITI